jgi:4-amino-4-deoxy-L-arabinose transferase-like glycosyltransferase
MSARRALWGLIAVATLLRLAWAASLGPGNDEAYYFLFTAHPDWSYFDQPPMVALVEAAGLVLSGGMARLLALRLGFIALFAGASALLARLTARLHGPRAGVLAAFLLNATGYYGLAAGTFALPDGPLLFFWLLTLDRLVVALRAPDRPGPWAGVGLAWGGALLSKYHAVFLPAGFLLFLGMERRARPVLRTPGPYLALALGGLLFAGALADNGHETWIGLLLGPFCAVLGWVAIGGLVERVRNRLEPDQAALLTAYADGAALVLAALAVFVPPLGYLAIPGFVLLLLGGRRREGEKYAGLRILR